jgi:hypothetical protein
MATTPTCYNHAAGSLVNLSVERVFSTGISTRSPKR